MTATSNLVEIEIDGHNNQSLYLMGKELRGRWDWQRLVILKPPIFIATHPSPAKPWGLNSTAGDFIAASCCTTPSTRQPARRLKRSSASRWRSWSSGRPTFRPPCIGCEPP